MIAIEHTDAVNSKILAVSEDRIQGFVREPFSEIARLSGVEETVVLHRIKAMLTAGTIRRVRQTLLATNLADGALVAWKVPDDRLDGAFGFMFRQDAFSGHVVLRSTDSKTAGSEYKLWTTIKVPQGFGLERHTNILLKKVGGEKVKIMPAKGIFTLGVGTRAAQDDRTWLAGRSACGNDSNSGRGAQRSGMAGSDRPEAGVYD